MPYKVFVSHSQFDRPWAEEVGAKVAQLGAQPYLFEYDLQPGTSLAAKLRLALRRSDAVVALLTPRSLPSRMVQQEIGAAAGLGKLVIPVLELGTDASDLGLLTGLEWITLDPHRPEQCFEALSTYLAESLRNKNRDQLLGFALCLAALVVLSALDRRQGGGFTPA